MLAAAVVFAAVFSCRPEPELGSVTLERRGALHIVDLATCRDHVRPGRLRGAHAHGALQSPQGRWTATVRLSGHGTTAKQTIWVTERRTGRAHPVFSETEYYKTIGPGETPGPIVLRGWSGDDRWIFFFIDPGGSNSIAADGLSLRVVSINGGRAHRIARMLLYPDYLSWCGGRLVLTAGIDRIATNRKQLLVAAPPLWRPHSLVDDPGRAWGSLACAPGGRSLVAQAQRQSTNANFFATRWALWRVGLDGTTRRLTSPPRGYADESPRFSRSGRTLMFVRSRQGVGRLYALRGRRLVGPILSLGFGMGYYGHQDWWQTVTWSAAR